MKKTSKWYDMVMQVQNANLQKQVVESKIKQLRKFKYRQELDNQIQIRNRNIINQNVLKKRQREQIQKLAEMEVKKKQENKLHKEICQQNYGYENLKLMRQNQQSRYSEKRKPSQSYKQHPFVKLVDFQDKRAEQLKTKFVKQNQINQLQQKIKQKNKKTLRYMQKAQLQELIKYEEDVYRNRQAERDRFKSKYLKIKRSENIFKDQRNPENNNSLSVQKEYVDYLNKQINFNNKKKMQQKIMIDQKIKSLHGDDSIPDSSPAYLGRNALSNDRKRQMHYLNKHLGINQRSYTQQKGQFKIGQNIDNDLINLSNFQLSQLERYKTSNPEIAKSNNNFTITPKKNLLFNKSHEMPPTERLPRNFKQEVIKQSTSVPKIQFFNNNQGIFPVQKQPKKFSVIQNDNRRIKSQFAENQPKIEKPQIQSITANIKTQQVKPVRRRQFKQYDVITGKSTVFCI